MSTFIIIFMINFRFLIEIHWFYRRCLSVFLLYHSLSFSINDREQRNRVKSSLPFVALSNRLLDLSVFSICLYWMSVTPFLRVYVYNVIAFCDKLQHLLPFNSTGSKWILLFFWSIKRLNINETSANITFLLSKHYHFASHFMESYRFFTHKNHVHRISLTLSHHSSCAQNHTSAQWYPFY